jgi:hypothetical protein
MQVLNESSIKQLPTFMLQEKFNKERDRVLGKLMYYTPVSHESLELVLSELKLMYEEMAKRRL